MATRLISRCIAVPSFRLPLLHRTMASSSDPPRKYDFLVILPDKEDALPRRLEARP